MDVLCKIQPTPFSKTEVETETKAETKPEPEDIIVCASCYYKITEPSEQISVNDSFVHIFANPYGHIFEIGCFSKASGCRTASLPSNEFSWFSGYEWQIGICRYCSNHLGWLFLSESKSFYGLILERIIFP